MSLSKKVFWRLNKSDRFIYRKDIAFRNLPFLSFKATPTKKWAVKNFLGHTFMYILLKSFKFLPKSFDLKQFRKKCIWDLEKFGKTGNFTGFFRFWGFKPSQKYRHMYIFGKLIERRTRFVWTKNPNFLTVFEITVLLTLKKVALFSINFRVDNVTGIVKYDINLKIWTLYNTLRPNLYQSVHLYRRYSLLKKGPKPHKFL